MNELAHHFYEFAMFRVDPKRRLLLRDEEIVPLKPKVFDTLLTLVENSGRVLGKEELMQQLWPDSFVEEANLTVNISALRKVFGENRGDHQYILTVPGQGYRFVPDVRAVTDNLTELVVQESKVSVVIEEEEIEGEKEGRSNGAIERAPQSLSFSRSLRRSLSWSIATLLLIALFGGGYWWQTRPTAKASIANLQSLAVLPFKSLTPKSGEEYLGVGLADVMITRLSNLNQLTVRPTSAVLSLADKDALQAGRALKVDSVLDGSIQQIGDRVRVTVRLLRTSDGQPLWAYQCDQECNDIFQLQDLVSANVTQALALKLTSAEQQRLNRRYTDNSEAYRAYLKGRYHTLQYTPEGNQKAVEELNEALRLDPTYALAWAGLADAYTAASDWLLSPREALPKAKAAAEKALALDDTLAEAHAALGHVFVHQRNPAAEHEFQRAGELSPNSVAAMFFYGEYFMGKDADKGVAVLRRVQQLDPLSPIAGSFIASTYLMARRNDEALQEAQQAVELDPNNPFSRELLAMAYGAKDNHAAAITELEKVKSMLPTSQVVGALGREYALAGRRAEASKTLTELQQMAKQHYVSPFDVALVYVGLGDKEQAFAYLEKALADQSEWMGWIKADARLDSLRTEPRFADLLRRVGL